MLLLRSDLSQILQKSVKLRHKLCSTYETRKKNNNKCNIIIQAYRSRCSSWKPSSKARIAKDFSTLLLIQKGEVLRVAYFWKRWFPINFCQVPHFSTKNPINRPTKNNKRILIASVFHFVDPMQEDGINIRRWHKILTDSAIFSKQVSRCCIHFPHEFSLLASSLPVNRSCSLPFSSFAFPSLFTYKQIGWIQSANVCCHNNFSFRNWALRAQNPYTMKY